MNYKTITIAAILFAWLFSGPSAVPAKDWEKRLKIRKEIWEGDREIRKEIREARREIRDADSPWEVRKEIREAGREIRREKREKRREVYREIRKPSWW